MDDACYDDDVSFQHDIFQRLSSSWYMCVTKQSDSLLYCLISKQVSNHFVRLLVSPWLFSSPVVAVACIINSFTILIHQHTLVFVR